MHKIAVNLLYNVWYELKIDKAYFINNYYERPGYVFRYGTGSYPLFFMSGKTDSADENALERDQIIYVDGIRTAKYQGEQNFTSAKFVFTDENGATTLDDVGSTPEFTVDANGNCEYYVKPIHYVGETLVPIEDIKLDFIYAPYVVVTQLENGVFKITQAKLNKGAVRATYDVTMQLTYTDDNDVVYRKYYRLVATAKIATE